MFKPMMEISERIESSDRNKIIITKHGSDNLLKVIRVNPMGNLFLPGAVAYITTGLSEEVVTESIQVGYNKARSSPFNCRIAPSEDKTAP